MNFNEKLIELRKKEGLSQEELGYKLNVTRQTISKWELGQTTPDMDKLSEISNLFGISVDNLLNEEEVKFEDKKISEGNEQKNKKIVIIILVVLVALSIIAIIVYSSIISSFKGIFNGIFNIGKENQESAFNVIDKVTSLVGEQLDEVKNNSLELQNQKDEQMQGITESDDYERNWLNDVLEMYVGTKNGTTVSIAIDKIVTNNKKYKDQAIVVTYQGEKTAEATEIQEMKSKLDKWKEYEVSYEYDENGYIYQMDILDID